MSSQAVTKSDDAMCQKYERFLSQAIMTTGIGMLGGAITSLILFKRRSWPIHWGIGIGFGYALKDLEINLNDHSNKK